MTRQTSGLREAGVGLSCCLPPMAPTSCLTITLLSPRGSAFVCPTRGTWGGSRPDCHSNVVTGMFALSVNARACLTTEGYMGWRAMSVGGGQSPQPATGLAGGLHRCPHGADYFH